MLSSLLFFLPFQKYNIAFALSFNIHLHSFYLFSRDDTSTLSELGIFSFSCFSSLRITIVAFSEHNADHWPISEDTTIKSSYYGSGAAPLTIPEPETRSSFVIAC